MTKKSRNLTLGYFESFSFQCSDFGNNKISLDLSMNFVLFSQGVYLKINPKNAQAKKQKGSKYLKNLSNNFGI